jgi:serine protease Do
MVPAVRYSGVENRIEAARAERCAISSGGMAARIARSLFRSSVFKRQFQGYPLARDGTIAAQRSRRDSIDVRRVRTRRVRAARLIGALLLLAAPPRAHAEDELVPVDVRAARDRVFPAVVRIDVHSRGYSQGEREIVRGTGSGVIIDDEGHVLTNFHVAGRAEKLIVTLIEKERVRARLIGADHWTDLALIRLDMEEVRRKTARLQPAVLGDSARIAIGEPVLAIGTPFGLSRTMTLGIVTNNERYFSGESIDGYETGEFNNWIQTDAAINPGNSGGPLVNMRGEVIGINTRAASLAEGLGFAVPIDVAKSVLPTLLKERRVRRSYVGLTFREMQDLETHFGLESNRGVLIESVDPRSPAQGAGLRPEDVLLVIDDLDVSARFPEELPAVRRLLADRPVGSSVRLTVKRGESKTEFTVTTAELEGEYADDEREFPAWGLTARSVTAIYAAREQLPDRAGVLVTGVKPASAAQRAGLEIGDLIRTINREAVPDLAAFVQRYEELTGGKPQRVLLEVLRGATFRILVLRPGQDLPSP